MSKPQASSSSTSGSTTGPGTANEDGMNIVKIVLVGVVSLVIFAVSAVVAGLIVSADERQLFPGGIAPLPADIAKKEEIGIIDYTPFDSDKRLDAWKAAKQKELTSYGWVDKAKGIVRIPIDQAMKDVIEKAGQGK